ncbi:MAG: hypothetical protein JSV41_11280 [Gemmatimonadota bacterium]|nr:MAG: hypothetical protein JSV41_11280 [Gemmatimonadota bacterium]
MSPSILEIFAADAHKYVNRLHEAMNAEGGPNVDGVRRACRRLHHAAVLANHEPVIHAATALQKAMVQVIAGKRGWSDKLTRAVQAVIQELDAVVAALPASDAESEARLRQASESLIAAPVGPPAAAAAETGNTESEAPAAKVAGDEADTVLDALIVDLGDAVERLENDPRDREPLKSMLRKIRRLRELERIEVLSPEDKALSAVEELILQIADLNATVGPGYLTVFRHAREVLDGLRAGGPSAPSVTQVGGRAVEVDRLKESVMEKARRARQVVWISDLFFAEGPHVVTCPLAEEQGGSTERYFLTEATQRLDRCENLRRTMLEADSEQMRLAGESLAHTLRHLRERAAAFNHGAMGRVARRAAAALRAQLVRPAARIRGLAQGFGPVFDALRNYLETDDTPARAQAVSEAETALHLAILGAEPELPAEAEAFDPDAALQQALALRTRVDERLRRLSGPDAADLREDLEELFDLVAQYVSAAAERH